MEIQSSDREIEAVSSEIFPVAGQGIISNARARLRGFHDFHDEKGIESA